MKKIKLTKKISTTSLKRKKLKDVVLYNEDCIKVLKTLPSNSIESCVTDPPYNLTSIVKRYGKKESKAPKKGVYQRTSKGFMGQTWDTDVAFNDNLWKEVFRVLKPGGYLLAFGSPKTSHRLVCAIEDAGFEIRDTIMWVYGQGVPFSHKILKAGKRKWKGWGTVLKPAHEPIVLARKPLSEKTLVENAIRWGTGVINIDKCRIGNKGRWPANIILDQEAGKLLDEQVNSKNKPSSFFYCPKVSRKERNTGCEHLKAKPQNSSGKGRTYNDRCKVCKKKFTGSQETRCQCPPGVKETDKTVYVNENNHPTVKPVALMEYLCKLITPKNGTCIDIFMGSGSTGVACVNLGFKFIGIEKEAGYFKIAEAKIAYSQKSARKNPRAKSVYIKSRAA